MLNNKTDSSYNKASNKHENSACLSKLITVITISQVLKRSDNGKSKAPKAHNGTE